MENDDLFTIEYGVLKQCSREATENNKGRTADGGIRGWHNTLTPEEAAEFWKNL